MSALNLNGATVKDGAGNAANLSGATNYNPAGTLQIDTTAPTIAISTIAGDNIVNATEGSAGFAISGTTTGAENGRVATINILNSANAIVNSYTKAVSSNAWSVAVTSAQATALADGSYTVSANVSDAAGNPAQTAPRPDGGSRQGARGPGTDHQQHVADGAGRRIQWRWASPRRRWTPTTNCR